MDGLNLARAMSYKNALAGIPYGGSKILVQCAPVALSDFEVLGFLAHIIDRTRSFTGHDIGFEPAMTDIMRERFTKAIAGGIITEDMIDKFKFDIIMGLANNQLRTTSQEGEIEIARQLARAGIFFVVEWAYNVAGVLAGWAEYIFGEGASFAKIKPRIELICIDNLRKLLDEARRVDKTPTELIYDKVEDAIYSRISFGELLYQGSVDVS